jgi:ubiquinone/menaquinone biosynthesis C-methylase UbiE/acyl carrier protein
MAAELYNLYGPTEATIDASFWRCEPASDRPFVPIGRPIANTHLYCLDQNRQPVPVGVPGELYIGGAGLARGYLHRAELTADRFIAHPFSDEPGARMYRTGDRVQSWPDGSIEFLGRIDHQVKMRGYRIELGEIEAVLRQHPLIREAVVSVRNERGSPELVAYVLSQPPMSDAHGHDRLDDEVAQVAKWQTVHDHAIDSQVTDGQGGPTDPACNTIGWNSSFTGQPIPAEEMREWLDQTIERIVRWRPQRVLEIGSGTGMLLFRLAPTCEHYLATDISSSALAYVRSLLHTLGDHASRISLMQCQADQLEEIVGGTYGAVILNSVVQYFPNVSYLLRVLEKAVRLVTPGGFVFIGDARSYPLFEALDTAIELYHAQPGLPIDELRRRIQQQVASQEELVVAPNFFAALKTSLPRVSHVQIEPKYGQFHNELSEFRYDVTLHIERSFAELPPSVSLDWQDDGLTHRAVRDLLYERRPEHFCIMGIPNAALCAYLGALALVREQPGTSTVGQLQAALGTIPAAGLMPGELIDLAQQAQYQVDIRCSAVGNDGAFDARFLRGGAGERVPFCADIEAHPHPWGEYANNPLELSVARELVPALRRYAQARLPEYMVPSAFMLLETLPLGPNGKLQRNALPALDPNRHGRSNVYVAPQTPVEQALATIWSEVLGIPQISATDSFFELGGHSLIAAQVATRVQSTFQIELPLRRIFLAPKLADLALTIEELLIDEIEAAGDGLVLVGDIRE